MSNFTYHGLLTFSKNHHLQEIPLREEDELAWKLSSEFEAELKLLSSFNLLPQPRTLLRIHEELYRES
jgi:hypothetical protein